MASHTITVYLGSDEDGKKIVDLLDRHCLKESISVSEYVKSLILKDLK